MPHADPAAEYADRLQRHDGAARTLAARLDRLGQARLIVTIAALAGAALLAVNGHWVAWALVGLVPLAGLFAAGRLVAVRHARSARAARYYRLGLKRLGGEATPEGPTGEAYRDPASLNAADLDLFGPDSLFQRLSTARTEAGAARLAAWLQTPATADEVRERQQAVADLRPRLDLREYLATRVAPGATPVDLAALSAWGNEQLPAPAAWRRVAVYILAAFNLAALVGWLALDATSLPLLAGGFASFAVAGPLAGWARRTVGPIRRAADELLMLEVVLARVAREAFAAPRLRQLDGDAADRVRALRVLADRAGVARNPVALPFALLTLAEVRLAFALSAWRAASGPLVAGWLDALADLDALGSLAAYSYERPADPFPTLVESPTPLFQARGLAHPLLPDAAGVRNDIALGDPLRLLLVSGSNMAGKSTFLRAVGVNAVLALAGGPVRAHALTLSPLWVGATMRVQDSLADGRSRFFAEVERVRAVLDRARLAPPLLFLLDELFSGTNSADRLVGARAVVEKLLAAGAVGLVTTHDLALTSLAEIGHAANAHFADALGGGGLHFDYALRPGVVPQGNGLALMRSVGLDV